MMLKSIPNILGQDRDNYVQYEQDFDHFYFLDPMHHYYTNIFFRESTIRLKENVWDIFDLTEQDISIFEHSDSQQYSKNIPADTKISDRQYVSFFFRYDN